MRMFESWLVNILLMLLILLFLLLTVVSCFWSVYLLDAIQRKWKIYRNTLRCIQQGDNDSVQQILAYGSKTEFVKFVLLFFMNLVEWLAFLFSLIGVILSNLKQFHIYNPTVQTNVNPILNISSYIHNPFFVLTLILISSLCMYLSERFAQKSWIKSNKIPYLIGSFLGLEIGILILTFVCTLQIIAIWCDKFLLLIAFLIAVKQYRKLVMIINWSIVDLKVSRNYTLLERQINSKRIFMRMFAFIWIGVVLLIISDIGGTILFTLTIVLRENNTSSFSYTYLCENSHSISSEIPQFISIIYCTNLAVGIIGASFILIPYTGYGLSTMCVILWRLIRGRTGYRTRFHNDLHAPLI